MHRDAERLFALDETLRREADEVLAASGIGSILNDAGFIPVGSYSMRTMVWRDLDFELQAEPQPEAFWDLCRELAATGWCVRMVCVDHYREQAFTAFGLYCGLRVAPKERTEPAPKDRPDVWKLDIWIMRQTEAETQLEPQRARWQRQMTEEKRSHILAIKEAACRQPQYGGRLLPIHIYDAVLEDNILDVDSFFGWWRRKGNWL